MRVDRFVLAICSFFSAPYALVSGQQWIGYAFAQAQGAPTGDPGKVLVGRLDLEKYKTTLKGLTQFGDRQQGTDRNRAAVDWIEAQLRSYGCTNTERIRYSYDAPGPQFQRSAPAVPAREIASGEIRAGLGGARLRGMTRSVAPNNDPDAQSDPALRALNAQPAAPGPTPRRDSADPGSGRRGAGERRSPRRALSS